MLCFPMVWVSASHFDGVPASIARSSVPIRFGPRSPAASGSLLRLAMTAFRVLPGVVVVRSLAKPRIREQTISVPAAP